MTNVTPKFGHLQCRQCGSRLSGAMDAFNEGTPICLEDGTPLIPKGMIAKSSKLEKAGFEWSNVDESDWIIHPEDLSNIKPEGIRNGCCGPDGCDGPNVACKCGNILGTEFGDCWMPHFMAIKSYAVELITNIDKELES